MTIVLGSLSSGAALHGTINATPWDYSRTTQKWFGVIGEYTLIGSAHGRELSAWCQPSGYASEAALQIAVQAINDFVNTNGTMTCTIGGVTKTYPNTIFNGFEMDEDPWIDASGINGWIVLGKLKFRQVAS